MPLITTVFLAFIIIWVVVVLISIACRHRICCQDSSKPALLWHQIVTHRVAAAAQPQDSLSGYNEALQVTGNCPQNPIVPVPVVASPVVRQESLPGYNEALQIYVVLPAIQGNYPQDTDEQGNIDSQTEYIDTSPPPAYITLDFSEPIR